MLSAYNVGAGLAGILINIIRIIILYIDQNTLSESSVVDPQDNGYTNNLAFYLTNALFQIVAASMYFIESKNPLA